MPFRFGLVRGSVSRMDLELEAWLAWPGLVSGTRPQRRSALLWLGSKHEPEAPGRCHKR